MIKIRTKGHKFESTELLRSLPRSLIIQSAQRGEALDYANLEARVALQAEEIASHSHGNASRVVIGTSNPLDALVSLFACWVTGQCAVLVNPGLAEDEKHRVIESVAPQLWLDDNGLEPVDSASQNSPWPDAALILMTSGTTGKPKGITHSLATLETRLGLNLSEIGAENLARTLCPLPMFFGHGLIGNCLTPLYAGQSLHILESPSLKDFAEFGSLIDRLGISFLSSVPTFWRMVLRLSPRPSSTPKRVHIGSAPLSHALWEEISNWCGTDQVFNTYGMTETANWISGGRCVTADDEGLVGSPWGGEFRVLNDGALLKEGRGEVALASPSLMLGLWGVSDGHEMKDGYFLTGDIGELSANQDLRLVGRSKNEINRAGIKVLAEEVDMLLERHPDVLEACSFGFPDEMSGELVGAVVRLREGAHLSAQELIEWCRQHARTEAVPTRIECVEEIAKNDRGKLARHEVRGGMVRLWS